MNFASDNAGPAAPGIIEALIDANSGHEHSYGADTLMQDVESHIRGKFEAPEARVFLVATGTAANALSVATICPPWSTLYCHRHSHVNQDECGSPEFYTGGCKLTVIDGDHARMCPDELRNSIAETALLGVHNVQRGAITITNATEFGAVLTAADLRNYTRIAGDYGLKCHLDGARFANALVSLGCTPAELSWQAGIDIMSFGGTKNGLLGVEAVIIFDPVLAWEFELRRKRGGHLFSKHRYLSAQMLAYLENDYWLDLATRSNRAAGKLSEGLSRIENVNIIHPVDANMIFFSAPRSSHRQLSVNGATYYLMPPDPFPDGNPQDLLTGRLVCNWQTSDEEIDRFLAAFPGTRSKVA